MIEPIFYLEKILTVFMIAYAIAMLIGEAIRNIRYDQIELENLELMHISDD